MSTRMKVLLGIGAYLPSRSCSGCSSAAQGKNDEFQPQNEFKLDPWISIKLGGIDLSINRAVFYLVLASALTSGHGLDLAADGREAEPRADCDRGRLRPDPATTSPAATSRAKIATRWFPFLATLFFFIWFSNMIGYLPLPTNTHETINIFGVEIPSFALYAATANISIPLALTLVVWVSLPRRGHPRQGPRSSYFDSWLPPGSRT